MGGFEDEGSGVGIVHGICGAGGAVDGDAGGPVLAVEIGQAGVDEFNGFAEAVMFGELFPALVAEVVGAALADAPVAGVGVGHAALVVAIGIFQLDVIAVVAQDADPVAYDVADGRVLGMKGGR